MNDSGPQRPISDEERARRQAMVSSTLGMLRIEALEPSAEALALSESFVEGELSLSEFGERIRKLHQKG